MDNRNVERATDGIVNNHTYMDIIWKLKLEIEHNKNKHLRK